MMIGTMQYMGYRRILNIYCKRLKRNFSTNSEDKSTRNTDSKNLNVLACWLFGVSGLVAGMVTVGGITRLTRSGLSMTDWKVQGTLPPLNQQQWEVEFEKYKKFPEYQQRQSMTVDEFKFIYFWEYGHRMMGRGIGLAFVFPLAYFSYKRMIPASLYPRLGMLFGLGGAQGLIGWWMVKSGLEVEPTVSKEIRVSPYRLATHLAMAFTTYGALLWTGLDLLNTTNKAKLIASQLSERILDQSKSFRRLAIFNGVLVATTIMSGAYVAGNDAGHAYNTYPKMGDYWIPPEILDMKPIWKNFFENTATVQFDHRILAITTLTGISWMYLKAKMLDSGLYWKSLPSLSKLAFNSVAIMAVTQVGLGITTLLCYVPISLAATHQAGSLVLLSFITFLTHSLRFSTFVAHKIIK